MAQHPQFSVVIPTHNRSPIVGRAVKSVLAQTCTDFEVLVVDDASTDDTSQAVQNIADPRVSYARLERNSGAGAARNRGIAHARGEFVSFLDDDDEYLPGFLQATLNTFENSRNDPGFVWCGLRIVRDTPEGEKWEKDRTWNPGQVGIEQAALIGASFGLTLRRTFFDRVGYFDETLRATEDLDFMLRLVQVASFAFISEILLKMHFHSAPRVSKQSELRAAEYIQVINRHSEFLDKHPKLKSTYVRRAAHFYLRAKSFSKARKWLVKAVQIAPLDRENWRGLLVTEASHARHTVRGISSKR